MADRRRRQDRDVRLEYTFDRLLVAKLEPHLIPKTGARIEVALELDAIHLFDAATERRLGA